MSRSFLNSGTLIVRPVPSPPPLKYLNYTRTRQQKAVYCTIEGGVRRNFNPDKRAEESELCVFKIAPLMISNSDPEERKQYYIETRKYKMYSRDSI
jgi:hypothetical protein